RRVLAGHGVADRVRDVDRAGPLLERDLNNFGHVGNVRAGAVLGRELDVVGVLPGVGDGRAYLALDVVPRGLQLALDVDVAGGDERVNARARGVAHRVPGRVDVLLAGAREPADHRPLDLPRDRLHRLEVAGRGYRKAGLDHVHAQPRQLMGDLELLLP